jgi:hypothetical protein
MRLAADFTNVLIPIWRGSGGAEGKSPKSPIDEVGFRGCQLAGTSANQHSFIVIHVVFSFRHFRGRKAAPNF